MDVKPVLDASFGNTYLRQIGVNVGFIGLGAFLVSAVLVALLSQRRKLPRIALSPYIRFIYASFIKSHASNTENGQQSALESFYSAQASVYDATRKRLLRGREDLLALVAAQLESRDSSLNDSDHKPVWYDIGGGTGYNIEVMDKLVGGIDSAFGHVFLVDLSPSLCEIARQRVAKLGWRNVTILCQDARSIQCNPGTADLITMSYSLSMIPDFYNVVDTLTPCLTPHGLIGICDFYVQSIVDITTRNYVGGTFNRHVNWLGRMFWRTWFDADRVNLDAGRRDYVEYRFGTILSASERNYHLGGIPYYLFVGCRKDADNSSSRDYEIIEKLDAALTESPYLSAKDYRADQARLEQDAIVRSKSYESAVINLAANLPLPATFYQQHSWRIHYNDLLKKYQQFGNEYIYAFNWEDPRVDRDLLNISKKDVILTITSAGDNILDYMLEKPKRIHAVDLNPNQNHLLELKIAAFTALPYSDVWKLFGEGCHPNFRELLIHELSPHLSSHAFQYWLSQTSTFTSALGLYETGGSRHAIKLVRRLFWLFGLTSKVRTMCRVDTLNEQREIWPRIREILLSRPLHWAIVSTKWWAWKAAGVPSEQRKLIVDDHASRNTGSLVKNNDSQSGEAIWRYMVNTLDPVVAATQLSRDNYFYYLCLQGKYSRKCHPRYLGVRAHSKLSRPGTFDGLRIHTDEIMEVIARITPSTLTIAILMDSMDWFTPPPSPSSPTSNSPSHLDPERYTCLATNQIRALNKVLKHGGRVLLRSAALGPWYIDIFKRNGFDVKCVAKRENGKCMDRVNMYASTWLCTKTIDLFTPATSPSLGLRKVERRRTLEDLRI